MWWRWLWLGLLVTAVAAKGKKHRHHKPGRALLDRLTSTTVSEATVISEAEGLLPAPLDVAPYSVVTANATCADAGADEYCRDTPGKRGIVCDVCEGLDGSPSRRHPASHAFDGDAATWWQSPTLAAGEEYQHVALVATLPDKMELLHVIIKSGPSPRPLAWSLEVSSSENGDDWRMIRAFGDRDHCRKLWDLRPERRRRKARAAKRTNRADKSTCSTQFASPKPLENGEMHVGIGEGVVARRVRASFRAAHSSPPRHQYYTVRALTLAARCLCHGHATRCDVDTQGAKCSCVHGTCGSHCQRCCAGAGSSSGQACEGEGGAACSCGERGACTYDDTGAIICVNCTDNRAGPLCDKCLFGYYNAVSDGPCVPCDCHPDGSDGSCKYDRQHHKVVCSCYPGFTGSLCNACEDPAASFPNCQEAVPSATPACKCDPRGVVNSNQICDDVCVCKPNVVGALCNACAPGHFGLEAGSCRPCYCSHVTTSCVLAQETDPPRDILLPLGEAWLVTNAQGNETVEPSIDEEGKPFVISYEVEGWENFYWMTRSFSGEQLSAYGGEIRASLFWGIVRGDTGGNPTVGPDVVLVAADGTTLSSSNTSHEVPGQQQLTVPLIEGSWWIGVESETAIVQERATRLQLLDALRDLRAILLRAHYHYDQDEVRVESVSVEWQGGRARREQCACPAGYSGAMCSRCGWRHVRHHLPPHTTPSFQCIPCPCNQHASCDTVDGPCGPCQHNTTGPHCERCLPGHYGNPVQGACKPCACPLYLASNNFSPNCALASAEGDEYVCTQCPDGYTGDHCENCDFGYWGSPTTVGSSCQACACGGSPCHPTTGRCLTCPANTEGARCDLCKEGYWFGSSGEVEVGVGGEGGVASGGCVPCGCGAGALSAACDARSGACACRAGWQGRTCNVCASGHGGLASGCPTCRCGIAAVNNSCDAVTGECACAAGAAPPSCDACLDEHYALTTNGCLGCNCSSIGSESSVCDIRSGQCRCKAHVTGRACDTCEEGYWGLERGGCRRCECGSGAMACDPVSGACACAVGVAGAQCDRCLPGYYGFGPAGCLPCPACTEGKVCSPQSGRCVCPGGSLGAGCRQCARGYWAHATGCRVCACGLGAVSNICDSHSGQCKCRAGWSGATCASCALGHYGPRCRPCHCDPRGTSGCEGGVCPCNSRGKCPCKSNVVGDKCDECVKGTFGLSSVHPAGCTACFCFGRTSRCTQAALARAALHAPAPRHLTLQQADTDATMDTESLLAIHTHSADATISLPRPPVPVYMELDKRFLGDRITSYGGSLRFRVEEEGGEELPVEVRARFPLVRLYGRNVVLDYYEDVGASTNASLGYSVRLMEAGWRERSHGEREGVEVGVSRGVLMEALRRLDRVLLRVTTRAPTHTEHVHALLLNVSLDTAIPGLSRSSLALGVEQCECPRGYSSSSCQDPAIGFWMPPSTVTFNTVMGTIVIQIEGEAQPCLCNNRATECHPDTGDCLNCTLGTGGPRCGSCAVGHHGSPQAPAGCQPCPCPSRAANYASACVLAHGRLQCLCKPGYTGPECEWCASGWVRASGAGGGSAGVCDPCGCDPRGSVSAQCDAAGRCRCRDHAAGDKCDQCRATRTYLQGNTCTACDNCTQTLLDSIEGLTSELRTRADPTELSRIPKPFPALLEFSHNATTQRTNLNILKQDLAHARNINYLINDIEGNEHRIFTEANKLKKEASSKEKQAEYLSLESMSALEEVWKQRKRLGEQVVELDDFARGERHLSAHRALKEARQLLRHIKDIRLIDYVAGANDVSTLANVQSTAVQEYSYRISDGQKRVRKLRGRLEAWEGKAADVTELSRAVWASGDAVAALRRQVTPRLAKLRDVGLRCRLMLEDITNVSTNNITDEIRSSLLWAQSLSIKFPSLAAELAALMLAGEEKEGILYNLTPQYRQKYLESVEKHVQELGKKAKEYKSLFAGSRAAASLGVSAAQAWTRVADSVQQAGAAAASAARAATAAATIARGPLPLLASAARARNSSEDLKRRGADVLAKAEELRKQLEQLRRGGDVVRVGVRGLGWDERALGAAPRAAVAATLAAAERQAARVFASTRVLYDEASELRRRVRYHLRRQLADLQRSGDTALGAAQEHVSQIRGDTVRGAEAAAALAAAAAARAQQHAAAEASLSPAIAALREKVARARHAAETISVSVSSVAGASAGAGCVRAYSVSSASPAVSRLSLAISFDTRVRDGPLLMLQPEHEETENYMKLFVENKKLVLTWNLGAGAGVILHPEVLQAAHDDADHTSYRIEIERIWNTVRLGVERAGGGSSVSWGSNSTGGSGVWLPPARLWLGAPGDPAPLPACVHALYTDDVSVGLWNFVHQPEGAHCTGCTQRWVNSGSGSGERSLVWFSGGGYAQLRRSGFRPSDRRQLSVSFTFRTRDQNALLFMAIDAQNNRSVSVVMRECRVVFTVEYSGSRLEISAGGRHCHGRTAHVQAIRVFASNKLEKGSLRVNGEETLGSPSPPVQSAAALPDLGAATYWVGGGPPGAGAGTSPPLLGCLGALVIDSQGYDLLDTPTRHGLEPSCGTRTLRSAILEGDGYIELPSPILRRKAAVGVSFRARSSTGLLMMMVVPRPSADNELEADGSEGHYLALVLNTGEVEIIASAGKGEVRLKSNGTKYDDGRLHTVRVTRTHKQLEMWVDGERVAKGTLAGGAFPAGSGGLYLGGVGDLAERQRPRNVTLTPFTGTIADLIVDGQLIGVESAVRWEGAQLGRADVPRPAPRTPPRALLARPDNAAGCTKTSSYTVEAGAVKFGDSRWSHATLRTARRRDLTLTMHFRTYSPDGLLMLAPGSKSKPKHYTALMLREGRVRVVVRARRRREVALAAHVADGTWRSVSVRISRARVVVSCGGETGSAHAPAASRAQRLYVGGIPAPPALPHLPAAIVRVGGFRGCVRRVTLNGRAEDLVRDAQAHHHVGQCFPNVEQGAYFGGDGYATWSQQWSAGGGGGGGGDDSEVIELSVQFRTTQPNGLLIAAGPLVLEVKDGAVVLSRQSSTGRVWSVWSRGAGGSGVCGGAWHAAEGRAGQGAALQLRLDGAAPLRPDPALLATDDDVAQAPVPLYIAGLPEGMIDSADGGRENFKGCIREVIVGGQKRDWTDMESLHNVLLDSCPIQ